MPESGLFKWLDRQITSAKTTWGKRIRTKQLMLFVPSDIAMNSKHFNSFQVVVVTMVALLIGCGKAPIAKLYRPSTDTDLSSSTNYNFSSFTGTVWRTKVEMSFVNVKRYTGVHDLTLLPPESFKYPSASPREVLAVLPKGSQVRIERLLQDNGAWGGLMVWATVDGTNTSKMVRLSPLLLSKNRFNDAFGSSSDEWSLIPEYLEKLPEVATQPEVNPSPH